MFNLVLHTIPCVQNSVPLRKWVHLKRGGSSVSEGFFFFFYFLGTIMVRSSLEHGLGTMWLGSQCLKKKIINWFPQWYYFVTFSDEEIISY